MRAKGLAYERIDFSMSGEHTERMQEIDGEGNSTVPGLLVDGEPVHGFTPHRRQARGARTRAAAVSLRGRCARPSAGRRGAPGLGRRLPWGALHFRPEALGTFSGSGEPHDGPGTDFAIKFIRAAGAITASPPSACRTTSPPCQRRSITSSASPAKVSSMGNTRPPPIFRSAAPSACCFRYATYGPCSAAPPQSAWRRASSRPPPKVRYRRAPSRPVG